MCNAFTPANHSQKLVNIPPHDLQIAADDLPDRKANRRTGFALARGTRSNTIELDLGTPVASQA